VIRTHISNLPLIYSDRCKIELLKTRIGLRIFSCKWNWNAQEGKYVIFNRATQINRANLFFNDEHYNFAQIHHVWEFILLVTTFLWSLNEIRTNRLVPPIAEATLHITSTLFIRINQGCTDTEYGVEFFLNAYYPSQIFFKLDLKRENKARQSIPSMPLLSSEWNVKRELKYLDPW
jgi:hypothetical protein